MDLKQRDFAPEFIFIASRSSGSGGQNVNKVSSKIEFRFNIIESKVLTHEEKEILLFKLRNKISNEGFLIIQSQTSRSQLENRSESVEKFFKLINKALTPIKTRKKTHPTKASKTRRLERKKILSRIKNDRKKLELDE